MVETMSSDPKQRRIEMETKVSSQKVNIKVASAKGRASVDAYHNGRHPSLHTLAFHRPVGTVKQDGKGWVFTHTKSGLGLGLKVKTIKEAREILVRLTKKFFWNFKSLDELTRSESEKIKTEIFSIRKEYQI